MCSFSVKLLSVRRHLDGVQNICFNLTASTSCEYDNVMYTLPTYRDLDTLLQTAFLSPGD